MATADSLAVSADIFTGWIMYLWMDFKFFSIVKPGTK